MIFLHMQYFGGRGSGGVKRSGGGGAGGGAGSGEKKAAAANTPKPKTAKEAMDERITSGRVTASDLNKLGSLSGSAVMDKMPAGTTITGMKGGQRVTYVKEANGKWRSTKREVVLGRSSKAVAQSDYKTVKNLNVNGIVYPR